MYLILTDDDGHVFECWYIPDEEVIPVRIVSLVERTIPVYDSKEDYETMKGEE
jgi:hypothetical protein